MCYCNLRALPKEIGALAGLKKLHLTMNRFLGMLLEGLCSLMGLEELNMRGCGLRALPEGIGGLAGLKKLDLYNNTRLERWTCYRRGCGHWRGWRSST